MCLRMRQCCTVHVTSATEADVRQSVAQRGVRLVSHSQVSSPHAPQRDEEMLLVCQSLPCCCFTPFLQDSCAFSLPFVHIEAIPMRQT